MDNTIQQRRLRRTLSVPRVAARPLRSRNPVGRSAAISLHHGTPAALPSVSSGFAPDPYVDYGRSLTPQGGIAIAYKDQDQRFRHTLRRLLLWSVSTGVETWLLLHHSPLHHGWINLVFLPAMGIVNWLIVAKPVEIYRSIEIRPDCMIIDGADVFWLRYMEGGVPSFRGDGKGNQKLCGIYGTRFIEYLTATRFDEHDRGPEVFAAHLQDAMRQLWMGPHHGALG